MPPRARTTRKTIASIAGFGLLIAATIAVGTPMSASAATIGTFTIGENPILLNQATTPGLGTLAPSADAATNGMFGPLLPFPVLPMHATLARNGHLVSFGSPINTVEQNGIVWDDWNPASDAHTDTATVNDYNSFCNSAVTMLDGRIVMVSGHTLGGPSSEMMTMTYDPITHQQTMGAGLNFRRWYVTGLRLPDSRILLLGGAAAKLTNAWETPADNSQVAITPEIGTGTGAWTPLAGATSTALFGAEDNRWWYPRAFNGPTGTVVGFSGDRVWSLDPTGNGAVQQTGTLPYNPRVSGSQVMYAPGRILVAGGGEVNNYNTTYGSSQAAVLDVRGATPQATLIAPMRFGRNWLNLTVLPNGEVFANGGTGWGTEPGDDNAIRQSEIWNPTTGAWRTAATNQVTRTYHSTSLVLPSGAVFTGGGGNPGPVDNFNAEMYFPSYLFTKAADGTVKWASRPAITSIAGDATYGGNVTLTLADTRTIQSASLISMPSVTHAQNTDQRRIPLTVRQQNGTVTVALPDSVNTAVPGDYELTVVDSAGVPSAAQVVTLRNKAAGQVTVVEGAAVAPAGDGTQAGTPAGTGTAGTPDGNGTTTGGGTGSTTPPGDSGSGAQQGGGTGAPTGPGTDGSATADPAAARLTTNSVITISSVGSPTVRVSHHATALSVQRVGARSSRALRRAVSWIVRPGLGSTTGYSFESIDRRGYFMLAPSSGRHGSLRLVTRHEAASMGARSTFSVVRGLMGHDSSIELTTKPATHLQIMGTRVLATDSHSHLMASTFKIGRGLASH